VRRYAPQILFWWSYRIRPMSQMTEQERNKTLLLQLIEEGFNKGNLSIVDEIVAKDCKEHQRGSSDGTEGAKEVIGTLRSWFPDFEMTAEDLVAVGDKVWARFVARGTNLGPFMGNPPTGKKVRTDVIDIVRFHDGKIVEHWGVPDQLGVMLQLGLPRKRP
jgi:predicted ester cyclase